ncbi:hypothetical protein [Streptomyces sp. H27-C3]|uniref:hypothetical protein n=1 Tax=Streptomyces sp. H27-C3 TaxID=3046305 RepID=UPI0024B9174D|nr:hypothetical protein [Streptomyces sp. H27-C3]MDJ0462617.1 hypothetical protein [Streptomyces sp. H27-C3]
MRIRVGRRLRTASLLHDLVLLPLYTVTDRTAQALLGGRRGESAAHARGEGRPLIRGWINYGSRSASPNLLLRDRTEQLPPAAGAHPAAQILSKGYAWS